MFFRFGELKAKNKSFKHIKIKYLSQIDKFYFVIINCFI